MSLSAAAVAKNNTVRFFLLRLTCGRDVTDDMAGGAPDTYTVTVDHTVLGVTFNGVALTAGELTLSMNEWHWEPTTGLLTIKVANAPGDDYIVVANLGLFYTDKKEGIRAHLDPEDDDTMLVPWAPKLLQTPPLGQSVLNMLTGGVFTIQDAAVQLANADQEFEQYCTIADSFNEKDVKIWVVIKNVVTGENKLVVLPTDNIQHVYTGKGKKISIKDDRVTFGFYDSFSRLKQPAYFGDTVDEVFAFKRSGGYSSMDGSKNGFVVPLILGRQSKFNYYRTQYTDNARGLTASQVNQAICTNYSDGNGTNVNREWLLCRSPKTTKVLNLGTTVSYGTSGGIGQPYILSATSAEGHNLEVGDVVVTSHGTFPTNVSLIWVVYTTTSTTWGARTRPAGGSPPAAVDFTSGPTAANGPLLFVFQGETLLGQLSTAQYGASGDPKFADFTVTEVDTEGGNKLIKITLEDDFESRVDGSGITFHPSTHSIGYVMRQEDGDNLHGEALQEILEAAGLEVDAASFAAANAALPVNVLTQIPADGETDYGEYLAYAQQICQSTLGIASIKDDGSVRYDLIAAPSTGAVENDNTIAEKSFGVDIDYNDIYTSIETSNPHYGSVDAVALTDGPAQSRVNLRAKHLHGVDRNRIFKHVLESMGERVDAIMSVISNRQATYSMAFPKSQINGNLNDDITLTSPRILGAPESGTQNLKILSIDKTTDEVSIVATDLEGFDP